jgi:hypothetical protein
VFRDPFALGREEPAVCIAGVVRDDEEIKECARLKNAGRRVARVARVVAQHLAHHAPSVPAGMTL